MAEDSTRELEDKRTHGHDVAGETYAHDALAATLAAPSIIFSPQLLSNGALAARHNQSPRADTLYGAQRSYGNRAVQRYLSVQRCGDTPCGCSVEEQARHALEHRMESLKELPHLAETDEGPTLQRAYAVQRQPQHAPADPNYSGTTPGDAYVGPGNGAGIGGMVSYGCYCGPGGDAKTGSRCGPGAAPKDAIDATCMRHDSDYGKAGVDSGSAPGTVNMFTDLQGWLKAEEADRRLADSVDAEMDANPGAYSPSARLFGQGIKGIFGGRANVSHAMNWGIGKYGEAEKAVTGAYDDVTNWGAGKYGEATQGVTGAYGDAAAWGSNKVGEAGAGISGFLKSASGWSSPGDVASGLAGGFTDATNWLTKSGVEAIGGAGEAVGDAANWLGKTGADAALGFGKGVGSAAGWVGNTLGSAAMGAGEAAVGLTNWGIDTAGALGNVGIDLAGRGLQAAGSAASDLGSWGVRQANGVWDDVTSWF